MAMNDKKVGELWSDGRRYGWTSDNYACAKLIRKLVEREKLHRPNDPYWLILRDFGIDPKEWQ